MKTFTNVAQLIVKENNVQDYAIVVIYKIRLLSTSLVLFFFAVLSISLAEVGKNGCFTVRPEAS